MQRKLRVRRVCVRRSSHVHDAEHVRRRDHGGGASYTRVHARRPEGERRSHGGLAHGRRGGVQRVLARPGARRLVLLFLLPVLPVRRGGRRHSQQCAPALPRRPDRLAGGQEPDGAPVLLARFRAVDVPLEFKALELRVPRALGARRAPVRGHHISRAARGRLDPGPCQEVRLRRHVLAGEPQGDRIPHAELEAVPAAHIVNRVRRRPGGSGTQIRLADARPPPAAPRHAPDRAGPRVREQHGPRGVQ